ncbi:hypothetical protein H5232_19670 [Pseudoalteromonas sp. SG41-5]|uniref:hypothetical protein n=1 Tax=Pseudoalteromonas sp. SG41-5 TaxID=2760975 RepID=UPI001600750F|nr:hypothetical protein [Pseudoalteromonas sp. SG41-5]MBB1470644.1 hypothetical protein [Pseudoalteromonas sp. SG41-5]
MSDTLAITLYDDIDDYLDGELDEALAKRAVIQAVEQASSDLTFSTDEIKFKNYFKNHISENHDTSLVHYLEANVGYFFVICPLTDQVNVVFCRWD